MYESEDLKVLLGNSIKEPEVEYDDEEVKSETGYPVEESALRQFYFTTIITHMAKPDFKENYLSVKDKIKIYTTEEQQDLAFAIIQNLLKKYDFEFSINFDVNDQEQIDEIYKCLEFIEYDCEKFITNVWKTLPSTNLFNVDKFCENNDEKIMIEIEEELETHYYSKMITDFLRTYNKENLIKWFCEKTKNFKISIMLALKGVN